MILVSLWHLCFCQEVDFAQKFKLEKFNKWINKKIERQIKKYGYREMKAEGVETYFIYNLSRNTYASWESLKDYSFLDSCELRRYLNDIGKRGDLRMGGAVFAMILQPKDSIEIGSLIGKYLYSKREHVEKENLFLLIRNRKLDYIFRCPIIYPDKSYGLTFFGVKNNKLYKICSGLDWDEHVYPSLYCIPLEIYIDNYDKIVNEEFNLTDYK